MFDFFSAPCRTGIENSDQAKNAFQPQKSNDKQSLDQLQKQVQQIQDLIDVFCEVYVETNKEEINKRNLGDKTFSRDKCIVDRASVIELENKIRRDKFELEMRKKGQW